MQKIVFESSTLGDNEDVRKDLWLSSLSSGYVRLNADPAVGVPFQGNLKIAVVGETAVGQIFGTVKSIARTAREVAAENTDNVVLLCNSGTGQTRIEQNRATVDLDPGCAVLIEQCELSRVKVDSAQCSLLAVQAPRNRLSARLPRLNDYFMRLIPAQSAAIMLLTTYTGALLSQQEAIGSLAPLAFEHIADFIAAAVGLVGATPSGSGEDVPGGRLAAILRELERSAADPDFSLPALARRLAVTPRYVQRLLAKEGTSFRDELTTTRLNRARSMILSPNSDHRSITEIATHCGFSSLPHFHRMFRRAFGETPGGLRARVFRLREP